MDHIPIPSRPIHGQIQVPLRCSISFNSDGERNHVPFSDYPKSQGWDTEDILIGDVGANPDAVEAFLQQWLFFNLIEEVVNSCGPVLTSFDDFICVDEQNVRYVTTKALPDVIVKWREAKDRLTLEEQVDIAGRIDNVLAEARYFVGKLTSLAPSDEIDLPMEESILLSIIILGETLEFSKSNIFNFKSLVGGSSAPVSLWGNRHGLGNLLKADGCCPNHVKMLEATTSAGTMYYAYLAGFSQDQKDHSRCCAQKCLAYQIDVKTYMTAHSSADCDCSFVAPPIEKVHKILSHGGIPVISLASPSTSSSTMDIDVIEALGGTNYVAISHVWSDGLGNPRSNSLPRCQVQFLRDVTTTFFMGKDANTNSRVVIWIDTLCVPIEEPLRGRAIELIQMTFERASDVLVLDNRLKSISSKVSYTENMMRIVCCGWLRRLWTFLEGVIAPKLFFLFNDKMVEVDTWILERFKDASTNLWNLVSVDASQFWWLLRRLQRLDSSQRVARLWNTLQWRSTSRSSDEYVCVASLFGLDVAEIVKTPVGQRMKKLLEMQQWFPPGIIFMNSTRLSERGFQWAPTSFLTQQSNELALINDQKPLARLSELGLFVEYPGLTLLANKRPVAAAHYLVDRDSGCAYEVMWQGQEAGATWQEAGCHVLKRPALILRHDLAQIPETIGILVDIEYEEDGCLFVRHSTRVTVHIEPTGSYESHIKALNIEAGLDVDEYLYVSTQALPSGQQWCIG